MSLFGTLIKQGAKFADEAFDASRVQAKHVDAPEEWDEAAWVAANPRPEGPSKSKAVRAWFGRKDYAKNRARRLSQKKDYQRENAEAIAKREKDFRERNAERLRAERKKHYAENAEKEKEKNRANYRRHAEERKRKQREYRAQQDPAEIARKNKEWREANAEALEAERKSPSGRARSAAVTAKRRAARIERTPEWADPGSVKDIYRAASEITAETGIPHHVDHIIPLQGKKVSGLHHQDNLMIVPSAVNLSKNNRFDPGDLPPIGGVDEARSLLEEVLKSQGR
jgi:hypothetical protein